MSRLQSLVHCYRKCVVSSHTIGPRLFWRKIYLLISCDWRMLVILYPWMLFDVKLKIVVFLCGGRHIVRYLLLLNGIRG